MFNPFRRKKKFPVHWLWVVTAAAVLSGVAAWVVVDAQWRMADKLEADYAAERQLNDQLATQLHGMKQFEGAWVGDKKLASDGCRPIAQIGVYSGAVAEAAPGIVEALQKRDATAVTAADFSPALPVTRGFLDEQAVKEMYVGAFPVRLTDGSVAWTPGMTVRFGEIYEVQLSQDYRNRHADNLCADDGSRPELSTCVPEYLTLWRGGVYVGRYSPLCNAGAL